QLSLDSPGGHRPPWWAAFGTARQCPSGCLWTILLQKSPRRDPVALVRSSLILAAAPEAGALRDRPVTSPHALRFTGARQRWGGGRRAWLSCAGSALYHGQRELELGTARAAQPQALELRKQHLTAMA